MLWHCNKWHRYYFYDDELNFSDEVVRFAITACNGGSQSGDHRCGETHVSISNTLVKPATADGSAPTLGCESRLLPVLWPVIPKGVTGLFVCLYRLEVVQIFLSTKLAIVMYWISNGFIVRYLYAIKASTIYERSYWSFYKNNHA